MTLAKKALITALCLCMISSSIGLISYDKLRLGDRPSYRNKAEMARYIMHKCDWGAIATLSTLPGHTGLPFSNVISVSDGPVNNASGIPYFYVTDLDATMTDVKVNSNVSLSLSEMQTGYCQQKGWDAEDPRCTRVTMTGQLNKVTDPDEQKFALDALFSRHPEMPSWSHAHMFYPVRLDMNMVWVIDFFGGATVLDPKDYYAVNSTMISN